MNTSTLLSAYPEIISGFFSREGGVSLPPYDSLNISCTVGDRPEDVLENRDRLRNHFIYEPKKRHIPLVTMEQVHKDTVSVIQEEPKEDIEIPQCDALITQLQDILLVCKHADCQPILLYDPVTRTIGCIHNGWKGSVCNIIAKTIEAMKSTFKTNPRNIRVAIGPSLGPDHAEFINFKAELPSSFIPFRKKNDLFDFWAISKSQFIDMGVPANQIDTLPICTVCNKSYFSFRRSRVTGRMASAILLKNQSPNSL